MHPSVGKKSPAGQEVKLPATFTSVRCVRLFPEDWVTKPVSALDLSGPHKLMGNIEPLGSHEVYGNIHVETRMGTQTRMSSSSRKVELTRERKCGEKGSKQKE